MAAPISNLEDLQLFLEDPEESNIYQWYGRTTYPVYGVMLYTPTDGLNELLHQYVLSRFEFLATQTGPDWLLVMLENIPEWTLHDFRPQDVYKIARFLGAEVSDVPCIVFFTEPKDRDDILVLSFAEVLTDPESASEGSLTALFGKLASMVDSCSKVPSDVRLSCLRERIEREWPSPAGWRTRNSKALMDSKGTVVAAGSVFSALTTIVNFLRLQGP